MLPRLRGGNGFEARTVARNGGKPKLAANRAWYILATRTNHSSNTGLCPRIGVNDIDNTKLSPVKQKAARPAGLRLAL